MADRTQLGQAAFDRQPVYYMDPATAWEQRLGFAYDEASQHIKAALPAGTVLDLAQYELATDAAGIQLDAHSEAWLQGLNANADPDEQSALVFEPEKSKSYYLGHYAQATANLGAFLTGYAREQIVLGALSQKDFDSACDLRLRAFSDIIHLGRTGALPALINGPDWQHADADSRILVATPGVYTQAGAAAAGLGGWPLLVGIAVVAVLVGAGIGVAVIWSSENIKQRRAALEICQDAVRRGHPQAATICKNMADVVKDLSNPAKINLTDALIPPDLQKQLGYLAAGGVGLALIIAFGPQIMRSLSRTSEVYQDEKIRRLRRLREGYGDQY